MSLQDVFTLHSTLLTVVRGNLSRTQIFFISTAYPGFLTIQSPSILGTNPNAIDLPHTASIWDCYDLASGLWLRLLAALGCALPGPSVCSISPLPSELKVQGCIPHFLPTHSSLGNLCFPLLLGHLQPLWVPVVTWFMSPGS